MIYHFTDSCRLPFILRDGWLRPGENIGPFPAEVLWATELSSGDPTATYAYTPHYRMGGIYAVRFTLDRSSFFRWAELHDRVLGWGVKHDEMLLKASRGADTSKWWCSTSAISLEDVAAIEGRTYANNQWIAVDDNWFQMLAQGRHWLGTNFRGKQYLSNQSESVHESGYTTVSYLPATA
jgi:hypothetical protein